MVHFSGIDYAYLYKCIDSQHQEFSLRMTTHAMRTCHALVIHQVILYSTQLVVHRIMTSLQYCMQCNTFYHYQLEKTHNHPSAQAPQATCLTAARHRWLLLAEQVF